MKQSQSVPTPTRERLAEALVEIGRKVRTKLLFDLQAQSIEQRAAVAVSAEEDFIFAIDKEVEPILIEQLSSIAPQFGGLICWGEGLHEGLALNEPRFFPAFANQSITEAKYALIIDPIDGTRMLMYDKRSAWFMAGACDLTEHPIPRLGQLVASVMVELPTSKHALADEFYAIKGEGVKAKRYRLPTPLEPNGQYFPLQIHPSRAKDLRHGFGQVSRFFGPGRNHLANLDDYILERLYPEERALGKPLILEDQYISTGGQLYEVLMGHDRFVADVRPWLNQILKAEGKPGHFTCHPYDCAMMLIATEAGCVLTDQKGRPFDGPFDLTSPVSWMIFANTDIAQLVMPVLLEGMAKTNPSVQ